MIIPVHKEEETIEECIESFLKQTYQNLEIIVVDDGSTDNTYQIASKYEVRGIKLDANRGVAHARNMGIGNAKGDIIIFAEGDGKYSPNYIETIIKPLSNPSVGGAICGQRIVWSSKNNIVVRHQNLRWKAAYILTKKGIRPVIGAWAYRKAVLNEIGGYNEGLKIGEDVDVANRIKKAGYTVEWSPGAYWYHKDPDTVGNIIKRVWYGATNSRKFKK